MLEIILDCTTPRPSSRQMRSTVFTLLLLHLSCPHSLLFLGSFSLLCLEQRELVPQAPSPSPHVPSRVPDPAGILLCSVSQAPTPEPADAGVLERSGLVHTSVPACSSCPQGRAPDCCVPGSQHGFDHAVLGTCLQGGCHFPQVLDLHFFFLRLQ